MGFRSTMISEHYDCSLPNWIKDKYYKTTLFIDGTLIASKCEWKVYDDRFFVDFQKALLEADFWKEVSFPICIAVLAEDQTLSRVNIYKDKIWYFQGDAFKTDFIWTQ